MTHSPLGVGACHMHLSFGGLKQVIGTMKLGHGTSACSDITVKCGKAYT